MTDFTSALYLGLRHPTWSLRPWSQLTTGIPAALGIPVNQARVARALAELQGCERAILAPSTLHLFWDLFVVLGNRGMVIYLDAGTYPIARWGVERAAARGTLVRRFPHHDPEALRQMLKQDAPRGLKSLVVVDGFCPGCGKLAPIADYLDSVRAFHGYLVLDDTQALGIFGHMPDINSPYGLGGGGSLRRSDVSGPDVLMASSLAKGFGVPVAVLAGSDAMVKWFEEKSETLVHASPPSIAHVHAAEHALAVNRKNGEALRWRLAQLVRRFRKRLKQMGFSSTGGLFPVQTLAPDNNAETLHKHLLDREVRTVLHQKRNGQGASLSFLITARHTPDELDYAVNVLADLANKKDWQRTTREANHETRI